MAKKEIVITVQEVEKMALPEEIKGAFEETLIQVKSGTLTEEEKDSAIDKILFWIAFSQSDGTSLNTESETFLDFLHNRFGL